MTLPIARELASSWIRVVSIAPGLFDTPMLAGLPQEARDSLGHAGAAPRPARQARGVRPARRAHRRQPDAQRRDDPPRRRHPDGAALSAVGASGLSGGARAQQRLDVRGRQTPRRPAPSGCRRRPGAAAARRLPASGRTGARRRERAIRSCVVTAPRPPSWGCAAVSASVSTGVTHASVPSKIAAHSSRVRSAKTSSSACAARPTGPDRCAAAARRGRAPAPAAARARSVPRWRRRRRAGRPRTCRWCSTAQPPSSRFIPRRSSQRPAPYRP